MKKNTKTILTIVGLYLAYHWFRGMGIIAQEMKQQ